MFPSSTRDIPVSSAVPRHVAIIMDGNGRWAKQRLLPRVAGHRRGVEAVRAIILACIERDIEFLTLFAFSSENWRRPPDEISILMDLFLHALEQEVAKLHANGIRFKVVGDTSVFDRRIRELVAAGEAQTAANTRLTLTVAANYGGRWDIAQAARRYFAIHPDAMRDGSELRSGSAGAVPRDGVRTGARSVHPYRRRAADLELPAVAARLLRALFHRHAVARLRRDRPQCARSIGIGSASAASAGPASRCRRRKARR